MIKNLFLEIHRKIKNLIEKTFRQTENSVYVSIFFVALIISSMYSYYISDYIGSYMSILFTLTIILFIGLAIFYKPIKRLVLLIMSFKSYNIISLLILYIFIYYFLGEISYTYPFSTIEYQGIIILSTIIIFLFSKSIAVFIKKKSIISIIFLIITLIPIAGIFYFISFPGYDTKEDYTYENKLDDIENSDKKNMK